MVRFYKAVSDAHLHIVTADFPPNYNAGSARALALIEALARRGVKVSILTHRGAEPYADHTLHRLPVTNPQTDHRFLRRLYREILFVLCAWARLLRLPRKSTVLVMSPPFFLSFLLFLLPGKLAARYVLDIRDLYPDVFAHGGVIRSGSGLYRLLSAMERRAYRRADLIFTVCDSLKTKIEARAPRKRVRVIMNGYSEPFEPLQPEDSISWSAEQLIILSHGNFGRFQNVELIRELALATSDLPVLYQCVGFGQKLDRLRGLPNVIVQDKIAQSEIVDLLKGVHLGLSFRTSDDIGRHAIPVKLLEYIGAYRPAVVVPVMPDLTPLAEAGAIQQFEAEDLPRLIEWLKKLCADPSLFAASVQNIQGIRSDYSRRAQAEQAAQEIHDLFSEGANTP